MDRFHWEEVRKSLVEILSDDRVLWKREDLLPYTADAYIGTIRAGEDNKYFPDFVAFPRTTSEVQAVVLLAAKHRIPLLPKGGGSNRTGMLVPTQGGIVVDTIKMNKIVEVSVPDLYVTVQPGITLKELDERLAPHGLCLNQLQGSYKVATVGGSISTAGFARKHQKYGVIGDRVMSLEVVLADGRVLRTGPKVLYTSTGYRLHQLFIGAEGTLGIITEATLRLEPLPEARGAVIAFFDDFWTANATANRIAGSSVTFGGATAFDIANAGHCGAPEGKRGALFIDFEGTEGEVEAETAFVERIITKCGGVLGCEEDAHAVIEDYAIQWCGSRALTGPEDELTPYVPIDRLREFYEKVWGDIMPRYGISALPGGEHQVDIGRYSMAYAQFKIPEGKKGWDDYKHALDEIARLAISLGGSVSCCIGVGLKHIDKMEIEFSETALEMMRRVKDVLDPQGIMNPGKKLPPRK